MKKAFLILGIAAAAFAVSCNKEEAKINQTKVFEGDTAYMVVTINNVGDGSATRASEGGYKYGTSAEYAISTADFYFYDEDGVYVTEASLSNPSGTPSTSVEGTDDDNIEYEVNTQVVLQGLTHTSYPNWVVTVLNKPFTFSAPETLEGFADLLSDEDSEGIMIGSNTDFVMSTSSYDGSSQPQSNVYTSPNGDKYYYATPVLATNFTEEPIVYGDDGVTPANCDPVDIYVERLSAKVSLEASITTNTSTTISVDGTDTTVYELTQSVSGTDEDGETTGESDVILYISLDKWALNATARHSAIVKGIDASWTNTSTTLGTGWDWNVPNDFRSYWGKCYFYGLGVGDGSYPTTGSNGNTDADEAGTGANDALSQYLAYTSLDGRDATTYEIGSTTNVVSVYCAENTNTAEIAAIPSALTSVLVKATVYDENGNTVDLVCHDGKYYTPQSYLNFVMEHLPTVYTYDENTQTYTKATTDILEFNDNVDGYVTVDIVGTNDEDETNYLNDTFYAISTSTSTGEDGVEVTEITVDKTYSGSDLQTYLDEFNTNIGYDANYYNGGAMYYNIPIEHLNNDSADEGVLEANYGVVRNHWYYLTITEIANLGKGIYDPDEVIVPRPEEPTYYVGADIHVLSWNRVSQGVVL